MEIISRFLSKLSYFLWKCIVPILSVGPMPSHVAFIMDGNRRYAKLRSLKGGAGHNAGYLALKLTLFYCLKMGIKHITVYAFSIDNFNRSPEEVQCIMDLLLEKIELELSLTDNTFTSWGVRVHFSGNLELLSHPIKDSIKRLMAATAKNSNALLIICFAYSSTDEVVLAIQQTCQEKLADDRQIQVQETNSEGTSCSMHNHQGPSNRVIKLADIEKNMYMGVAPDPDIIIRTSGENRLSNFLLWQSPNSCFISFRQHWPAITGWHLVWAVLKFQRDYFYLEKKKKQI